MILELAVTRTASARRRSRGDLRSELLAVDSVASKSRGIGCPAGTNLLGGAGFTVGGGEVVLDDLRPSPTGFTALGREDRDGFAGSWGLEATAICA